MLFSTCNIHNAIHSSFTSEEPSVSVLTILFPVGIKIKIEMHKRNIIDFVGHPVSSLTFIVLMYLNINLGMSQDFLSMVQRS